MKKIFLLTIVLFTVLLTKAQVDTNQLINDATELQKHSKLYFWYATESKHKLQYYDVANEYALKSNKILHSIGSKNPEILELISTNNSIIENYEVIKVINKDNVNGRYPLFTQLMGENINDVKIDDANELCIESALIALGNQLKGSKTIFNLPYFTVIETNYKNPELDEVIRQAITSNSDHYVITKYELTNILGGGSSENKYELVANEFNTKKLGIVNVEFIDSVDDIYYNSAAFSEFDATSKSINQLAYIEAFKQDVNDKLTNKNGLLLFVLAFLFLLFIIFRGWEKNNWIQYFITSIVLSYFITLLLIQALRTYDISGIDYYLEYNAILWKLLVAIIFSIIPIIITYIAIMKVKFLVEEVNKPISLISIIYGVCVSSIIFFSSLEIFENGYSPDLYNYLLVLFILFIPSQTSGRIASRLLVNHEKINMIPLVLNLTSIAYIFFILLSINSIVDILTSIIPVLLLSIISFYFKQILEFIKSISKSADEDIFANSFQDSKYIYPNNFDELIANTKLLSEEVLQVNIVCGEKGTGKTRLIKEIEKQFNTDIKLFFGDCDQETSVVNYEPFVEAFSEILGAGSFSDQASKAKMLSEKLSESGLLDVVPAGKLIDSITTAEGDNIRDYKVIIKELLEYFKKEKNDIVIAIDDLHNIDENSFELLKNLIYEIGINYNSFNKISFLLTSTDNYSNDDSNMHFLKELSSNDIIKTDILYSDLLDSYTDFASKCLNNLNLEYESEMKIQDYLSQNELEYPLHIIEAIKLIDTYKMFDYDGRLSLKKKVDLMKLPINKVISGIFHETIEELDTELFNILECAAYIGKTFEANVIVHIIGKDRLEILNRLREAEDLGLVIDKSDADDIYEFTSRALMKELKNYNVKINNINSDINISQIVKEYNERIINYFYELNGFDVKELDINLLLSLANRSFENNIYRTSYNERCLELNKIAAERTYEIGDYNHSLQMYQNLYKLADKFKLEGIKIDCLLIIIECYLNTGEIHKALEYEKELKSANCNTEKTISKDLLIAKLYNNSSREKDAFDLLLQIEKNKKLDADQQVQLKLLLAEIYDYKEEDELAFEIYNTLLLDSNLKDEIKTNILSKLADLHLQHGDVEQANHNAVKGYKLAIEQKNFKYQADFLYELILISMERGDSDDFNRYEKCIQKLSKESSVDIKNQMSVILTKFSYFTNNMLDYTDLDVAVSRLLKMVKYTNNQHKESQLLIIKSIAKTLNGNSSESKDALQAYLLTNKLDADIRMKIITTLLYTDLSVLEGNPDYTYFNEIDLSIIKEIPALLPKFNLLDSLKNGLSILESSKVFYKEILKLNNFLLAEEFPLCVKLTNDKKLFNSMLEKYFMADRFKTFLNG